MKQIALLLIAIALSASALLAQALPENPQPAQTAEPVPLNNPPVAPAKDASMWDRLQRVPRGQKIKIRIVQGRWERCEFAGATDAYLYCAQAWEIDRLNIEDFKLDHDVRNGRIAFATGVVSVGLVFGLLNTRDEGAAVAAGMLGALVGMIPGGIASCVAGHCIIPSPDWLDPKPSYAAGVNVPLRTLRRRFR